MNWKLNARLAESVAAQTGMRHCRSCDKERRVEGGKVKIAANGRRIWRCKACSERSSPKGFR